MGQNHFNEFSKKTRWLYDQLRKIEGLYENQKFQFRGPVSHESSVVVLAIDEESLEAIGRWPWPRAIMADVVRQLSQFDPRVIGFDIVFAEKDNSMPPGLAALLQQKKMGYLIEHFDGDRIFSNELSKLKSKRVLG